MSADKLDTFIVYNERRRVTSSAKRKRRHADNSLHQVIIFWLLVSLLPKGQKILIWEWIITSYIYLLPACLSTTYLHQLVQLERANNHAHINLFKLGFLSRLRMVHCWISYGMPMIFFPIVILNFLRYPLKSPTVSWY